MSISSLRMQAPREQGLHLPDQHRPRRVSRKVDQIKGWMEKHSQGTLSGGEDLPPAPSLQGKNGPGRVE